MKLLLVAVLAILGTANAADEVESEHEYMYFPDGDGNPHLIDLKEVADPDADFTRNVETITFNLFTRSNRVNAQILVLDSISTVTHSYFDRSRPTRFVTHGWRSSQNSDACGLIRKAYLETGDYNVIVVDWSSIAGSLYTSASSNVPKVAAHVASFINFMVQQAGLNVGNTKLIGHSLGAHVSGIAAHQASGTIQSVVALDPALPGFNSAGVGSGVTPTDAAQVQVIHTCAGYLGLKRTAGTVDFYLNGGSSQPGCGLDAIGTCAHSRSYMYFAESIQNPNGFRASGNVFMGGRTLTSSRGTFNLKTNSKSPFALG